ncbi:MAG: FixH family protein [Psychroflexus halocasei]
MKLNWGQSIVIAFVLFISFIMYFVITMITDDKYDNDLVVESYYEKDLTLQNDIDQKKNALDLDERVTIEKTNQGLKVTFPDNFDYKKISGELFMYRPIDKEQDFTIDLDLSSLQFTLRNDLLEEGRWDATLKFQYEGQDYMVAEKFLF